VGREHYFGYRSHLYEAGMGTSESESAGNQTNTTGEIFGAFGVTQRNFLKNPKIRHNGMRKRRLQTMHHHKTTRRLLDVSSIEMNLRLIEEKWIS
jgi:hypothetical protein